VAHFGPDFQSIQKQLTFCGELSFQFDTFGAVLSTNLFEFNPEARDMIVPNERYVAPMQ
jgi:hypothetical protein